MIKNGRPFTIENGFEDAELITDIPDLICKQILDWIRENIFPRKTVLSETSSYGLKHILEQDIGIYLTNNQFKDAMQMCGFTPVNPNELNWKYCISKRSPALLK